VEDVESLSRDELNCGRWNLELVRRDETKVRRQNGVSSFYQQFESGIEEDGGKR
jgi:hypothetical protein